MTQTFSHSTPTPSKPDSTSHFLRLSTGDNLDPHGVSLKAPPQTPAPAATSSNVQAPTLPQRPFPQRIAFLRCSARAKSSQHDVVQSYPFCPAGPTLQRVFDRKERLHPSAFTARRRPSPLRQLGLTAYSRPTRPKMPHGLSMPQSGFQALILCGPGAGLNTFTSVPHEHPKALISIANRPMVWYALDWCYRMGVTDITLVTPPTSQQAIKTALAQNPYLTSLPSPSPDVLAPPDLDHTTPTAELLRLSKIQEAIKTDFILLPCDLVCDIPGEVFIESYLTNLGGLGAVGDVSEVDLDGQPTRHIGTSEEKSGRRGGLSIWYNTANRLESVKNEECDFMCTSRINDRPTYIISDLQIDSAQTPGTLRKLAWTMPMSELQDECEENKAWKVRRSLLRKHGDVKCLTRYRDSHIYFLPLWVKEFARLNEDFESISEDLIGTWAKCCWRKPQYRKRYNTDKLFPENRKSKGSQNDTTETGFEDEIDLLALSSTQVARNWPKQSRIDRKTAQLASRVPADPEDSMLSNDLSADDNDDTTSPPEIPAVLSCILPSGPEVPMVRRVDTAPLLLSVSLALALCPSIEESSATQAAAEISPFAHATKVANTTSIAPKVTISRSDSLIDSNTTIATMSVIKSSVVGSSVTIGTGVRLTNCLVMDGASIGDKSVLNGTIVGKRAKVGKNCTLNNCEIQDGNIVEDKSEGKGEKYLIGGLEDDAEDNGLEEDIETNGDGDMLTGT